VIINFRIINDHTCTDIQEFVKKLKLEKVFKKIFKCDIDNFEESQDSEAMDLLLENIDGFWYWEYHDIGEGYFTIYEIDSKNPVVKSGKSIQKEEVEFS